MRSAASWGIWKVGICLILNLEIMKHNLNFNENTGGYSLPLKKSLLIVKVSATQNSKMQTNLNVNPNLDSLRLTVILKLKPNYSLFSAYTIRLLTVEYDK